MIAWAFLLIVYASALALALSMPKYDRPTPTYEPPGPYVVHLLIQAEKRQALSSENAERLARYRVHVMDEILAELQTK